MPRRRHPPEAEGKHARQPLALRLAAIERAIVETEIGEPEQLSRPSPRPGLIDFDPARRLSPRAARLDRLIRAMIADKGLLRGEPLAEACARVGARQAPAANSALDCRGRDVAGTLARDTSVPGTP